MTISSISSLLKKSLLASCVLVTPLAQAESFERPKFAKRSIYERSAILTSQGVHTLLPKGCVLHIPKKLEQKFISRPQGPYISWPKFYAKNRAWLHKHKVSTDLVTGKTKLTPEELERFKSNRKIVIALYKGNPTSVKK